ncbi:MAG: ATP-dependent Clp protease ATP-binding subunit ClpC [Candidatus Moraniibacteriota bacterium]|nr:MAG: ATP-dependent Clp protease ATP-binding subunit ClpC [Candidatus Moranbacteria bacterium]
MKYLDFQYLQFMKPQHSMTNKLTLHAKKSISHAEKIAGVHESKEVRPEHLLYGIFLERGSVGATILRNIGLSKGIFEKNLFCEKVTTKKILPKIKSSDAFKKIITDAHALASEFGYTYVGTEHFVYVLLNTKNDTIQKITSQVRPKKQPEFDPNNPHAIPQNNGLFGIENLSALMGEKEIVIDSTIDQFCTFISQQNKEPFFGRNTDIERIITILGRRNKNNPLIIGEPGIGKTAVIEHIAHLAKSPNAPRHLYGKEIVTLDLAMLVAGTSFRGEFEQRLKNIISEVQENPHIILFIDEIHTIIGTGNTGGSLDAANILKPALARGNVRIIGATTLSEYKKHIEKDPALERRFQKITLEEPTVEQTKKIISGVRHTLEKHHNVIFTKEALNSSVTFTDRYLPEQRFPDKAIDILDETAARLCGTQDQNDAHKDIISLENNLKEILVQKTAYVRSEKYEEASQLRDAEDAITREIVETKKKFETAKKKNHPTITEQDIAQTITMHTNIPQEKIMQTASRRIIDAKKHLTKKIIGQNNAVEKISDTLIRSSSGISNEKRPNGSFLFLGTTGVGKTFTAQTLAEELYETEKSLIRVDMSEFMEKHHASKLLGAPAGYVGYGEGGTLTEKVRNNPHSVVLFDEIEKAHPDVFNILLQILEDGMLTDASGKKIDFKNTIIILTSNIGSAQITQEKTLGFDENQKNTQVNITKKLYSAAKETLSPELLSRLDHVIVFNELQKKELQKIARNELLLLKKRLHSKEINFSFTPKIINHIAQTAQEKNEGARGVRQYIQDHIEGDIAYHIAHKPDTTTISIDYVQNKITIS